MSKIQNFTILVLMLSVANAWGAGFLDVFDRPDGDLGNDWAIQTDGTIEVKIVDNEVLIAGEQGTDWARSGLSRAVGDETRISLDFKADDSFNFHIRVDDAETGAYIDVYAPPGSFFRYASSEDGGWPGWTNIDGSDTIAGEYNNLVLEQVGTEFILTLNNVEVGIFTNANLSKIASVLVSCDSAAGTVGSLHIDNIQLVKPPAMIPVPNAGFEDPVLAEDDWSWLDVSGWTWVGGEGPGIWHVTSADFDPVVAPEGQNVLYTENAVGDAGGVAQVLTETFAANTDYTLTAEVGNSYYYYFAGYSVQLLAGGTVIAEDNDTLWPDYMKWATSTVQYTYDSADSVLVGQPLEIRLLNLGLDKDNPTDNTVGVEFDNVTLSYEAGAEPGVTITVEEGGDIAAANELANAGDAIEIAAGTYVLASQIEIKDGVTYRGAGPGLTIIDGNDVTRAFAAFGDRSFNETNENPNNSGPKGWVLDGMTIQNCVADTNNRFSYAGAAFDLLDVFADNDVDASGGLSPEEADADVGGIRLAGADLTEGTEDDDLHRFAAMDADGNGELSEAELNEQLLSTEEEFGDQNGDGGAITIHNQAVGTIQNCDFLNNHTPIPGDGDDGGAINIAGLSVVTINDCLFNGNYACSPTSVSESDETGDADGDGGHIKVQGGSASAITPGTTLVANRCVFLNGRAEDDSGAIQSSAVGSIIRLDACWFEGNNAADDGTVLFIGNESSGELTVTNCVFANNISTANSDRMCQVRRNSKFINCTFVGNNQGDQDLIYNNANTADTDADGVDDETADTTQVINCIFANNVVGDGDDVLGSRNDNFSIAATNCLFFGNTLQNGDPADNTQRPDVETGSVLSDPLLDADLVPGAGSEAIDGGVDPTTVGVTLTNDYNGDTRPKGAAYDIGAFEVE